MSLTLLRSFEEAGAPIPGPVVVPRRLIGSLLLAGHVPTDLIGPITALRGDDVAYLLIITDDTGERVDLRTISAIEAQVKTRVGAADPPLIAKALGSGVDPLDQDLPTTRGQALIVFGSTDTNLPPGLYALDVVAIDARRQHVIAPRDYTIADVVNPP